MGRTGVLLRAAALVWLGLACAGAAGGQTRPAPEAKWTRLTDLPGEVQQGGANLYLGSDGFLYLYHRAGTLPHITNRIYRAPAENPAGWVEITGKGLAGGQARAIAMGNLGNGVPLVETSFGRGNADVFFWDGAGTWKRVKGWTGESTSYIYNFAHDAAGNTYFSPAWSGDIWRTTTPTSNSFKAVEDNLYGRTNGGAADHPATGGLYQVKIWDLGDGKGEMLWACGEGELDSIDLRFHAWTGYLTDAQGYGGNCTSIDRSAKTIGAFRMMKKTGDVLSKIDIATRKVKVIPAEGTGFPPSTSTNAMGTLHWLNGDTWMFSSRDTGGTGKSYLVLSTDDLETWHDLTALPGIDDSCKGANLFPGAVASAHYVFARCQSGRVIWRYGPL